MSGKWTIRFAREADVPGLLNIYRAYIGTPVTFEYELPSEAEFAARVAEYAARYPYLVCEAGGRLLGYAYAHRLFTREAYQWIAELTVYLAPEAAGRGLGKTRAAPYVFRNRDDERSREAPTAHDREKGGTHP